MHRRDHHVLALIILCIPAIAGATEARRPPGFTYISPMPGAMHLPCETTIILRATSPRVSPPRITVEGALSGTHTGDWLRSDDGATLIFAPGRRFAWNETVEVSIDAGKQQPFVYTFSTASRAVSPLPSDERLRCLRPREVEIQQPAQPEYRARADTTLPPDFPLIDVTHTDNPEPGMLFLSNFAFSDTVDTAGHLLILDDTGAPAYYRKMANATIDFKKQSNGLLTYFALGTQKFHAMDSTYTVVDSFEAGNGYTADFHDLQILPNEHALLLIYDSQPVDMSLVVPGGDPTAIVEGLIIQELDSNKNVVFQWRSWDHFQITDSKVDLTVHIVDYVHGNALQLDGDGNILLSSRHFDEITKIDRSTGDIIWRMGGRNNEFALVGDVDWFSSQHDIRRLANGNITLFDNGNLLRRSRSVEYAVDEINKVMTLVWQYRNTPDVWGWAMGSSQRLPGGNTLIGWGAGNPTLTEIRPDGSKAFELTFDTGVFSYRAFRFPWSGVAAAPYLWADTTGQVATLGFEKFGDPDVQYYYVYQGQAPDPTTRVDSTSGNTIVIGGLDAGTTYYFRVTAVDDQFVESSYSNNVSLTLPAYTSVLITSFEAVANDGEVELSWNVVDESDLIGFNIYRVTEGSPQLDSVHDGLLPAGARSFTDRQVASGTLYRYFLGAVENTGEVFSPVLAVTVPSYALWLGQNYPNPFNPATTIPYRMPRPGHVTLELFDVAGRLVRVLLNGHNGPGNHIVEWDGRNAQDELVGSGVYYCRLRTEAAVLSKSLIVLR